jgi:hypothetical protein
MSARIKFVIVSADDRWAPKLVRVVREQGWCVQAVFELVGISPDLTRLRYERRR